MELEEIKRFVTTKQEQYKNILEIIEYHQNIINSTNNGKEKAYIELLKYLNKKEN